MRTTSRAGADIVATNTFTPSTSIAQADYDLVQSGL